MKRLIILAMLLFGLSAFAQPTVQFYYSTTNSGAGSGTFADPWKALSSGNWTTFASYATGGTNVILNLQNGSIFRAQWSLSGSGQSGNHIVITNYLGTNANLPVITGADTVATWTQYTPGTGSTWTNSAPPARADFVFFNGTNLTVGASSTTLNNHEFIYTGGLLYVRWDEGNPDSLSATVEATTRTGVLNTASARNYIDFWNINFRRSFGPVARVTGTNFSFNYCLASQGTVGIYLNNCNAVLKNTTITDVYGNYGLQVDGANGAFNAYYCQWTNLPNATTASIGVTAGIGGGVVNCTFVGSRIGAINNSSSSATIGVTNCVFVANGAGSANGTQTINSSAGTAYAVNCMIGPNAKATSPYRNRGFTEINTIPGWAQFVATSLAGYIGFQIDDIPNYNWAWLVSVYLDRYNWKMAHAASTLQGQTIFDPPTILKVQDMVNRGHDITDHSSYHSWIPNIYGFSVQYSGSAAVCTMDITGSNTITFKTNGVTDFSVPYTTNTLGSTTIATINSHAGYASFALVQVRDPNVPPVFWTNATLQDIKTASWTNQWIQQSKLNREVITSQSDIHAAISNVTIRTFTYPNGALDNILITNLIAAGFLGSRGVNSLPAGGYLVGGTNNIWNASIYQQPTGYVLQLGYENNALDNSPAGSTYTNVNVVYQQTNVYDTLYSAYYDGATAYMWKANTTNFDASAGDFAVGTQIYNDPTGTGRRALWYNGTSDTTFIRFDIDTSNVLHTSAMNGGVPLWDLSTGINAFTNAGWNSVFLRMHLGVVQLSVNDTVLVQTTTNVANPPNIGGTNYWGRAINFAGSVGTNYYKGLMDDSEFYQLPATYVYAMCDLFGEEGDASTIFAHANSSLPHAGWINTADYVREYTAINQGAVYWATPDNINLMILTNAVLYPDGQTYMNTNPPPRHANYQVRPTSPLRFTADISALRGQTNLFDMAGNQITDGNGIPLRSKLTVGGYEFVQKRGNALLN